MSTRRFLIIDDHPLMRAELRRLLTECCPNSAIREAASFAEISRGASPRTMPHLVVLDLQLRGVYGFSGLLSARVLFPNSPILILSEVGNDALICRSFTLGVKGFATKAHDEDDIRCAIASLISGGIWLPTSYDTATKEDANVRPIIRRLLSLTPNQMLIFTMIREGLTNKQIARNLCISVVTVKAHITVILRKLGVLNRTQAVVAANAVDEPFVNMKWWKPIADLRATNEMLALQEE